MRLSSTQGMDPHLEMLLEDLRNSVHDHYHGGSAGGTNSNRRRQYSGSHQVTFANGSGSDSLSPSGSLNKKPPKSPEVLRKAPLFRSNSRDNMSGSRGNLSELDMLLQDLENKQNQQSSSHNYSTTSSSSYKGNGPVAKSVLINEDHNRKYHDHSDYKRPEVDCLLDGRRKPTASSATQELDDLMQSLSDFKMQQHTSITTTTTTHEYEVETAEEDRGQKLDSMLGSLQADMTRQGITTTQKGCCHACNKPIVGQVVTALGKTWHMEHFTCTHCNCELATKHFFDRDGKPYCESDYHELFSPRCAYCNKPILDKCVTALDQTWHPEHFFCHHCGKTFGDDGFHDKDGKAYCRDDYFLLFAPRCAGCAHPIKENYISALNVQWHSECFVCRDCHQPFVGGSFYDHEGMPYCETHYHAKRGSLCAGCHKPIVGRCITAMFRKYHPEHFVCSFCLKQLNKGVFKEERDKPYCHGCFDKLFG